MFNNTSFGNFQPNANPLQPMNQPSQQPMLNMAPQSNAIALPDANNLNSFRTNTTPTFGNIGNQPNTGVGLFGSKPTQSTIGLFGNTQPQQPTFGQGSNFGAPNMMQNASINHMSQPQGGHFGQNKPLGFSNQGNPAPISSAFGTGNTGMGNTMGSGFGTNMAQSTGFGVTNQTSNTSSPFSFGQQTSNNAPGNTPGIFSQNKPNTGFGLGNTNTMSGNTGTGFNTFGNNNTSALGGMGNTGLGGLNNTGMGGFGNTQNKFQSTNMGLGQQHQGFGLGQPLANNMQRPNQGTTGVTYKIQKNAKNNNVYSIRFLSTYSNVPSNILRMQDYMLQKTNQISDPQISQSFNNYLQVSSGSQGLSMTSTNMNPLGMSNNMNQNQGFMGMNNQNNPSSLLGNQSKPSGLFNTPNLLTSNVINTQPNQPFGNTQNTNIFNKPMTLAQGTNLQSTPTTLNTGGLFGNTNNNLNQGGLFQPSAPTNQTPSLFGNTQNINKPTGSNEIGLFGNQTPSLFNGPNFGNTPNLLDTSAHKPAQQPFGTNTSGGLFGNTNQQPGGLFAPKTPMTGVNLFGPPIQQPSQPLGNVQQPMNQNVTGVNNTIQLPSLDGLKGPCCIYIIPGQPTGQFNEQINTSLFNKPNYRDLMDEFASFKLQKDYDDDDSYKRAYSSFYQHPSINYNTNIIRPDRYKKNVKKLFTRKPTDNKNMGTIKFIDDVKKNEDRFEPVQVKSFIKQEDEDDNMIRIELIIYKNEQTINLAEYFKSDSLVTEIVQNLARKKGILSRDDIKRYKVYKDGHELDNLFTLDEYSLQHGDRVTVATDCSAFTNTPKPINPDLLPKKSQKYTTMPSFKRLEKMSEEELKAVPNFTVISEYATLEFEDPVDLRSVDIDKTIKMSHKMVEVYPESEFGTDKPRVGEKLNKSAFITFNNFNLSKQGSNSKFISRLKELAASMNATVIDVDKKNDTLKIYVEHF